MVQKLKLILSVILLISLCGCSTKMPDSLSKASGETQSQSEYSVKTTAPDSTQVSSGTAASSRDETDEYGNPVNYYSLTSPFPLYAMLKSDNIYLYGVNPSGMILYQNGKGTYFDWPGLTPRCILPELSYLDYNGDGKKELAVTVYWGSGTGVSLMDLHILEIKQPDSYKFVYTDHALLSKDVTKWFTKPISAKLSKDRKSLTVSFDGQDTVVPYDFTDKSVFGNFIGTAFGEFVEFKFVQSKIKVDIGIGVSFEKLPEPQYVGTVEATVSFTHNQFSLSDYTFTPDE